MLMGLGVKGLERREQVFLELLRQCLGNFRERQKVIVMGDLNAQVGDTARDRVSGVHGLPGTN